MIDLNKLNSEEKEAIKDLQKRVADVYPQDLDHDGSLFYRFLKARDFNLDRAEKMLRKHFTWRKAYQIATYLKDHEPKEFFHKYVEPTYLGFDKENDIIFYAPFGKIDARDALKCTTLNGSIKTWMWMIEKIRSLVIQNSDQEKCLFSQVNVIIDLDQLTFSNTTNKGTADILIRLLHVLQDNYPEGMKCITVINAPSYYVFIWSIVKVFMSQAMIQKIRIFSGGWEDKLLEKIDIDVLPAFLGGTRTDPDGNPLCKTFVMQGGKIPPSHYLTNEERYFKDPSRVKKITVYPSGVKEVYVDVLEEGSVLHWEIFIKGKDIGVGLFYKEMNELKEMLPIQRIDTTDGVDTNHYRTKLVGKYVLMFDNGYSWLSTKEIEYCITIKNGN